jgi:hypothetical protein
MRYYHCQGRPATPIVVDYSAQLQAMITLAAQILAEVSNHQVTANVDLSAVLSELNRIYSEMQNVNSNIQATAQMLLNQFVAVTNSIGDFKSASLAAFASLQQAVVIEGNETQEAIDRLTLEVRNSSILVEVDLHPYEFIVIAGATGGVFSIPEGTVELFVASTYCKSIVVNNIKYPSGSQIGNQLKSAGNHIFTDGIYEIQIQPEDEISVSWRSRRDLGDIRLVSGDLISEKGRRYPRTVAADDDLTGLADLVQSTVEAT